MTTNVLPPFEGTRIDPLTHRAISWCCWNSKHEPHGDLFTCLRVHCKCGCHPEREDDLAAQPSAAA